MKEWLVNRKKSLVVSLIITILVAYLFYDSAYALILFFGLYLFVYKGIEKTEVKKTKMILKDEFREMILSMASAIESGNSVEGALKSVEEEMKLLYGEESIIVREIHQVCKKIETNCPVEKTLEEMAVTMDLEEAIMFSETFKIGKRIGGDMNQIIMDTSEIISVQIETEKEIECHLTAKIFEFRIMCAMPFAIILYVRLSSPGYFRVLYHSLVGVLIMTFVLFFMLVAYKIGQKVIAIDI